MSAISLVGDSGRLAEERIAALSQSVEPAVFLRGCLSDGVISKYLLRDKPVFDATNKPVILPWEEKILIQLGRIPYRREEEAFYGATSFETISFLDQLAQKQLARYYPLAAMGGSEMYPLAKEIAEHVDRGVQFLYLFPNFWLHATLNIKMLGRDLQGKPCIKREILINSISQPSLQPTSIYVDFGIQPKGGDDQNCALYARNFALAFSEMKMTPKKLDEICDRMQMEVDNDPLIEQQAQEAALWREKVTLDREIINFLSKDAAVKKEIVARVAIKMGDLTPIALYSEHFKPHELGDFSTFFTLLEMQIAERMEKDPQSTDLFLLPFSSFIPKKIDPVYAEAYTLYLSELAAYTSENFPKLKTLISQDSILKVKSYGESDAASVRKDAFRERVSGVLINLMKPHLPQYYKADGTPHDAQTLKEYHLLQRWDVGNQFIRQEMEKLR